MSIIDFIKRHIVKYKDLLANLSRKNRELFYREGRSHSINLTKPPRVDDQSITDFKEKFQPLRTTYSSFQELLNSSELNLTKHFMLDEFQNSDLQKKLDKIRLADQKFKKEFGISGAWILGPFLCWRDTNLYKQEDLLISPVFKLPIDIKKDKKKNWTITLEDSDLKINPSLRLALRQKCGIRIPESFESNDIKEALAQLEALLSESGRNLSIDIKSDSLPRIPPRYKIIRDEQGDIVEKIPTNIQDYLSKDELDVYQNTSNTEFILLDLIFIDHMNASRVVLLRDYDTILESDEMHPILSELFLGKAIPSESKDTKDIIKSLDTYKEKENFFVVNADSAQHRAIDQTNIRNTVIIQGPPGTGKSQTITNLIAKNLAEGKKVLFVSEKRAALDVVFSRLQQANLSSQSVLIHSSDLNKQELYNSFLELSTTVHDEDVFKEWSSVTQEFDSCKEEINAYYEILIKKHSSGIIISDLLALKANLTREKIDFDIAKLFSSISFESLKSICDLLAELQSNVSKVNNYSNHPWLLRKSNTIYTATFESELAGVIEKINKHMAQIIAIKDELTSLGIDSKLILDDSDYINKLLSSELHERWIGFVEPFYLNNQSISLYKENINKVCRAIESMIDSFELLNPNVAVDMQEITSLDDYYSVKHNVFALLTFKYWKMNSLRKKYLSKWDGTSNPFKAFITLRKAILFFKSLEQNKNLYVATEPLNPRLVLDECKNILTVLETVMLFNLTVHNLGEVFEQQHSKFSVDFMTKTKITLQKILVLKQRLDHEQHAAIDLRSKIYEHLEYNGPSEMQPNDSAFFQKLLDTIQDLNMLDRIDLIVSKIHDAEIKNFTKDTIINTLIKIDQNWGDYVFDSVIKYWVDRLLGEHPEIRTFDSVNFANKINNFIVLENEHRESARKFVNNTLYHRWNKGSDEFEGLSLLRREANKRNRVKAPRELMEQGALKTMLKLKPCWLMSPLSISQILPSEMGIFDMVIFDEASQVRVEDAVPSIYRGKTMVVVGDPKQMPPTNFFSSNELSEEDEDEDVEISPSILDMAIQVYPSEILEWHYRSRAESLIAFSNRAFYGGRLIAVPNPNLITEGDAIKLHVLDNAIYNKTSGNIIEAEALVERLYSLLKLHPNKSYGIIAMGLPQMRAIEETIERKKTSDDKFKKIVELAESNLIGDVDAGLFVKSLENVQGDERDVILLSVGYGPSILGKKVHMNFGPLSKSGGGRRLNVAITRAKENIEIFCSFDPKIISTDENDFTNNPDLVLFGRYLKYTQAIHERNLSLAQNILNSFGVGGVITSKKSSNFSLDVKRRLEEIGYTVSAEIGSSGFYVDLAVHHPVIPTNFILGIECDGAIFHSTPYARDRDKIRQNLLESRGWKIARVWSQDWSKDWKSEINKLDQMLKSIMQV